MCELEDDPQATEIRDLEMARDLIMCVSVSMSE